MLLHVAKQGKVLMRYLLSLPMVGLGSTYLTSGKVALNCKIRAFNQTISVKEMQVKADWELLLTTAS